MSAPFKMRYSSRVYHTEVKEDTALSVKYEANVLCGVASGDVKVFSTGLPGACGSEFSFYYPEWNTVSACGPESEGFSNYLLALALSANNGWGHGNEKCFTVLTGGWNDDGHIDVE